ncbi:MAG TPA: putative sulfate exporter family transporter, partial [Steroidobacteraceae bacterium]|nr:putative sulfate exporter family transporter [Steroidobacteraceae bacterium]
MTMNDVRALVPGLLVCATIAAAAGFLSEHYGGPPMLFAVLLGLALNFLRDAPRLDAGIEFVSRVVLRVGVALLGLRITFGDIHAMGVGPLLLVGCGVITTILFGIIVARASGQGRAFGVLTGGAVAICGVSAALAISATLPRDERSERNTSFAVIGVTALSTLAMIFYPTIVVLL